MSYKYFSHNRQTKPIEEAVVPLASVEYSYGFGVYESIRLSKGIVYFLPEHSHRLMESARIIGLEHTFSPESIGQSLHELIKQNQVETCNVKILLIGGKTAESANLYILCLNPRFPDRKLYKNGAPTITYDYERNFPGAKTLNMLPSYLAFRNAQQAGAYDALLVNRQGCITEGTRTNFFTIKGRQIYTPPEADILPGVTRQKVLEVARQNSFEIIEQDIKLDEVNNYDGAFLTSTSSKIMPISSIDDRSLGTPPRALQELMAAYDSLSVALSH